MKLVALVLFVGLVGALAAPASVHQMEHGVWQGAPSGWKLVSRAPTEQKLALTFAVKQRNTDALERILLEVSDPTSPKYGRHLSMEAVHRLVAPARESVVAVTRWLESAGVNMSEARHSPNSDFITVTVTVAQAEALLHTSYANYHHADLGMKITRVASPYHVPVDVAPHLDFIAPTLRFPAPRTSLVRSAPQPNDLYNTPNILHQLYQVPEGTTGQVASNVQAIASFLEQYWDNADLQTFFKNFQNSSVGHTVAQVIGPNSGLPGTEASLDIQYIMGVGQGVTTWAYYTPGRNPNSPDNEPFLAWMMNVSAETTVPSVISVSYGEDEKSVGLDYATRVNVEFQKAGARGISLLFASGDSGTGGNCSASGRFNPNYPTGSPYVTSVGGLTGGTPGKVPTGEEADYISGGGFSDWWPMPSWQQTAVQNYLSTASGLPNPAKYNSTGRAYPDVSAQSEGFVIVQFGLEMPGVGGTSCATPTFAGVVGLLNDLRAQAGKAPLGFLNPLLYQIGANPQYVNAFNDAVKGINAGCDGNGFPAQVGWDPVTGWGSPNYKLLAEIVKSLP